jgi:Uncharacterized conserved protein
MLILPILPNTASGIAALLIPISRKITHTFFTLQILHSELLIFNGKNNMVQKHERLKSGVGILMSYFLQGMLLIAPIFVTIYAIFYIFNAIDSTIEKIFRALFHYYYPGVGIVVMFFFIAFIGYIGSLVVVQPLLHLLDTLMEKTPLVKDIYSTLKDFFAAFISNKKKFDKPVMFETGKNTGVFRLGFITQDDLSELKIKDKVAVYAPWSYNLSGTLYLVDRDQIQPLSDVSAGDVMKFVVSGGVTEIEEEQYKNDIFTSPKGK